MMNQGQVVKAQDLRGLEEDRAWAQGLGGLPKDGSEWERGWIQAGPIHALVFRIRRINRGQ